MRKAKTRCNGFIGGFNGMGILIMIKCETRGHANWICECTPMVCGASPSMAQVHHHLRRNIIIFIVIINEPITPIYGTSIYYYLLCVHGFMAYPGSRSLTHSLTLPFLYHCTDEFYSSTRRRIRHFINSAENAHRQLRRTGDGAIKENRPINCH